MPKNIRTEAHLQEALIASQSVPFCALIGNIYKGVVYGEYWEDEDKYKQPLGKLNQLVASIRSKGVLPSLRKDMTTIGGREVVVILCSRQYFVGNGPYGKNAEELFVLFRKPLDQVFVDYDDFDLGEFGVPPKDEEKISNIIDANEAKGVTTSLSAITTPNRFHAGLTGYGSWVREVKPNEITMIVAASVDNDYKTSRKLW